MHLSELTVYISGDPGTGTTTLTQGLASELQSEPVSAGSFGRALASLWIKCKESDSSQQGGDWKSFEHLWRGLYHTLLSCEVDNTFQLSPELTVKEGQLATFFTDYNLHALDLRLYDKTLDLFLLRSPHGVMEGRVTAHLPQIESWFLTNEPQYHNHPKPQTKPTFIRLATDQATALERLTNREATDGKLEENIKARKRQDWERYYHLYGINIDNPPPQTFIIDTNNLSVAEVKLAALFAILTQDSVQFEILNPILLTHLKPSHQFYQETIDALLEACPQILAGIQSWEAENQLKTTSQSAHLPTHIF